MSEGENGDFISRKKFKTTHDTNDETYSGGHKGFEEGEAGNYFLGPVIKENEMSHVTQCLARKKGTDDYYLMKMLYLDDSDSPDKCSFVRRTVFHNEYSFLTLLKNHPGVIQLCDFFKEYSKEGSDNGSKTKPRRICVVMECLIPHGHHNLELISLDNFLNERRLNEAEALYIFYNFLQILEDLHKRNIVHRALKFSNIIVNRRTLKVKLMDFYYAELVTCNKKVVARKCRSTSHSSHISNEEAVLLKICDMCSAGVILHGMLNDMIIKSEYSLSKPSSIAEGTKDLLRKIQTGLEASEAMDMVSTLMAIHFTSQNPSLFIESNSSDQVVPECPGFASRHRLGSPPAGRERPSAADREIPEREAERGGKQKGQKVGRGSEGSVHRPPSTPPSPKPSPQGGQSLRKEIRHAMLRLGVTSVNNINALSFNYSKKGWRRSDGA